MQGKEFHFGNHFWFVDFAGENKSKERSEREREREKMMDKMTDFEII